jgi:hypothetical protein
MSLLDLMQEMESTHRVGNVVQVNATCARYTNGSYDD